MRWGPVKSQLPAPLARIVTAALMQSTVPPRSDPPLDAAVAVAGVLDEFTMSHLLDVELARARRYEDPFALVRIEAGSDPGTRRRLAGALRDQTRWADSIGEFGGALLVILRNTSPDGARFACEKIGTVLAGESGAAVALRLASASWRKGDDRASLLARLD